MKGERSSFQRAIDGGAICRLHRVMSRPHRILVPGVFVVAALAFSSCVGTIYDRTYSNKKNYYKPAKERLASADAIMGAIDKKQPDANTLLDSTAGPGGAAPTGLPPADGGVPGLPPPGAPDAGAPAGAPGGAPAPAAGAIPGLPPATPPAAGTPPPPPPK